MQWMRLDKTNFTTMEKRFFTTYYTLHLNSHHLENVTKDICKSVNLLEFYIKKTKRHETLTYAF